MLCLARREGEVVRIDGPAEVVVLEIRKGNVRLGFHAPETTKIVREEAKRKTPKKGGAR